MDGWQQPTSAKYSYGLFACLGKISAWQALEANESLKIQNSQY